MSNTNHSRVGSSIALVFSAAIIALAAWLFLNRQYVIDLISVWSYQPSSQVAAIEERAQLTEKGRFAFYATKPDVLDADNFNNECPRQEVGNPILGCYTSTGRIYVFDLTDPQLDGMEEVTAAHEMLHSAWQRLGETEKKRVEALLEAAYAKNDDAELKTRMEYYQRTEPGEFTNELHSILGTEEANLGDELESYYQQYFDRANMLALHGIYKEFYTGIKIQADDLFAKMESLSASIDAKSTAYDQAVAQLSADINSFNARADAGSFSSTAQFNAERRLLMSRSNTLQQERDSINNDIATYNVYYEQYNQIAKQLQILNDSMDSYNSLGKAPSV